jgi:hypothetical protein
MEPRELLVAVEAVALMVLSASSPLEGQSCLHFCADQAVLRGSSATNWTGALETLLRLVWMN